MSQIVNNKYWAISLKNFLTVQMLNRVHLNPSLKFKCDFSIHLLYKISKYSQIFHFYFTEIFVPRRLIQSLNNYSHSVLKDSPHTQKRLRNLAISARHMLILRTNVLFINFRLNRLPFNFTVLLKRKYWQVETCNTWIHVINVYMYYQLHSQLRSHPGCEMEIRISKPSPNTDFRFTPWMTSYYVPN